MLTQTSLHTEDLFKNRIPRGAVVGVAGPWADYNGQVITALALSAATGIRLVQGFAPARQLRTLALFGWDISEQTYDNLWRAFDAYQLDGAAREYLTDNLHVVCEWNSPLLHSQPYKFQTRAFAKLLEKVRGIQPDLVILNRKEAFTPLSGRHGTDTGAWHTLMRRLTNATVNPCSVVVAQTTDAGEAVADECLHHVFFRIRRLAQCDGAQWGIEEPRSFFKIEQTAGTYGPRSQSAILPRGWDAPEADAAWLGRRAVA